MLTHLLAPTLQMRHHPTTIRRDSYEGTFPSN
jgi:hypothetical protein